MVFHLLVIVPCSPEKVNKPTESNEDGPIYRTVYIARVCCEKLQHTLLHGYFFKNLEYPCPYWTLRETRLRVAEEMLDSAMT